MNGKANTSPLPELSEKEHGVPFVSIVILTFNSEKTLDSCLHAISLLDYPAERLEVIIVDNGSNDLTLRIARKHSSRCYAKPDAKITELRNFGAGQARGEIIAFVDSDCEVETKWLMSALCHLKNPDVGLTGCNYAIPDDGHWIEKAWGATGSCIVQEASFVPAGNMLLRREVFEEIGGFDQNLETGEDTDLCARITGKGYKVISDPRIRSIHWGNPKTLVDFLKKEMWYGKGMVRLLNSHDFMNKTLVATNVFVALHFALVLALILPLSTSVKLTSASVPAALIFILCLLAAWYRCRTLNIYRHFFRLVVLWYFYFLGRSMSMMNIYFAKALRLRGRS